jgi:hypothetical protein
VNNNSNNNNSNNNKDNPQEAVFQILRGGLLSSFHGEQILQRREKKTWI